LRSAAGAVRGECGQWRRDRAVVGDQDWAGAGDDETEGRLAHLRRVDLSDDCLEEPSAGRDLLPAELDLDSTRTAVGKHDDGVDLLAVGVAIVTHLSAQGRGEHREIVNDGALEQHSQGVQIFPQLSWPSTQGCGSEGRVDQVDLR
jgi:hypothetical protein